MSESHSIFDLVCFDAWGPALGASTFSYIYYIDFMDDFTWYSWIKFLKHQSKVFKTYEDFAAMIHRQCGIRIKTFRAHVSIFLHKCVLSSVS